MALFITIIISILAAFASALVRKNLTLLWAIAIGALLSASVALFFAGWGLWRDGSYAWSDYFLLDFSGLLVAATIAVVGLAVVWYSGAYMRQEMSRGFIGFSRVRQYFTLFHLFLAAMFLATFTDSPILMWIGIEVTTLSTAFLISFYGRPSAVEAAWKYLLLNSVGLLLGFLGTLLFIYPVLHTGEAGFLSWQELMVAASDFDPALTKIAFIFVLIGYGTKVGLVPMHTWRPDAYSKAPSPLAALFSGSLLNVALLAILRFKAVTDAAIGDEFAGGLLIFFGALSVAVASFSIWGQKNYKRLLAYSSIEHAGIMALGFGFGGIGTLAAYLHMLYHALAKSALFLTAGNIFLKYGSTKVDNVSGVLRAMPVTGALFLLGFIAASGLPIFALFVTEFLILLAGVESYPWVVAGVVIFLAVSFVGFLRQVAAMMFGADLPRVEKSTEDRALVLPIIALIALLTVFSLLLPVMINIIATFN